MKPLFIGLKQLKHIRIAFLIIFVLCVVCSPFAYAGDWATYRGNIARSGATADSIGEDLFLQWVYQPQHRPVPAWPVPGEEMPRNHSDNAYHTCIADGKVYFGSSVTNEVVCLDIESGSKVWSFFAEGPVRYAPTVYEGKVYFGSDDGYVYCVDGENGQQAWKYLAGLSSEKVIGNGRMISLWPVRTSVLVDKGEVYFAAGVFPYEGIYICALKADSGEVIWKNDTIGDRSHELQFGGISPAGYLLASDSKIYIPSGRSLPAAFDRKTGKEHFVASPAGKQGGTWALLDEDKLIAGVDSSGKPRKVKLDATTGKYSGDAFGWFPGVDMAVTRDHAYVLTQKGINSINRSHYSNSVFKANSYSNQRKDLGKQLKELQEKISKVYGDERKALVSKVEEVSGKIAKLTDKEREVKNSSDKWFFAKEGLRTMVLAGDVIVAGGDGEVVAVNAVSGESIATKNIKGGAAGLAVGSGRLVVSSDNGNIYCYGKTKVNKPKTIKEGNALLAYSADDKTPVYDAAARKIAESLESKKGYCLVVDCGEGRLAYEIAKRTEMQVVALEKNAKKLAIAREKLSRAGMLGKRVVVEAWDIEDLPVSFANLIVSDGMLLSGKTMYDDEDIKRVLRPYGGVLLLGKKKFASNELNWTKTVRGKLEGAGEWTHQYANAQNTASSGDELVSGRLGIQWFGEPGPDGMVERHAKAASPLAMDGRLFVQGEEVIFACDAFNGTLLWKKKLPGAFRVRVDVDSSNVALTSEGLYIAAYDKCYVLDPATGEELRVFELPKSAGGSKRRWGYISVVNGKLFGSAATPLKQEYAAKYKAEYPEGDEEAKWAHQRAGTKWRNVTDLPSWENYIPSKGAKTRRTMVSDMFFAMNAFTGELFWKYDGKEMANISMTIADGSVFLTDAAVAEEEKENAFKEREKLVADKKYEVASKFEVNDADRDVRRVVCLDAKTGDEVWSKAVDLTGCCGDTLASAADNGVLLLFGSVGSHDMWRFQRGQIEYRRVVAMSTRDGKVLWSKPHNYMTRPLILEDMVIVEPRACDLYTGALKTREHPVTGQTVPWEFLRPGHTCSMTAASANSLFYRSSSTAMYNLEEDRGVTVFGGYRPGCWLTVIPACGLVLSPEASSGCTCSFPIRCSFALVRKPEREKPYTVFITPGSKKPVKHLALNLGAPADMKADDGTVWFGYPGPKNDGKTDGHNHFPNYGVKFKLNEKIEKGMGYFSSDFRNVKFAGTDKPWLFTSGCVGLSQITIPLLEKDAGDLAKYTVRLGFMNDGPASRVFDIKMQGKTVANNYTVKKRPTDFIIVKEFAHVGVEDNLVIELVSDEDNMTVEKAPIINFIEVVREDAFSKSN